MMIVGRWWMTAKFLVNLFKNKMILSTIFYPNNIELTILAI